MNLSTSWSDPKSMKYHSNQWEAPKRSTEAFTEFCYSDLTAAGTVLDLGSGGGAGTHHLARRFPETKFIGIDNDPSLVGFANQKLRLNPTENLSFEEGSWFTPPPPQHFRVDGVVSLQTLSWLPEGLSSMVSIFRNFEPGFVALSSLFYDGEISCRIEVTEHLRQRSSFYNVYAIPELHRLAQDFWLHLRFIYKV